MLVIKAIRGAGEREREIDETPVAERTKSVDSQKNVFSPYPVYVKFYESIEIAERF